MEVSVLYGNIAIYAAYDRKPRLVDFDYSNVGSDNQGILTMVSTFV